MFLEKILKHFIDFKEEFYYHEKLNELIIKNFYLLIEFAPENL